MKREPKRNYVLIEKELVLKRRPYGRGGERVLEWKELSGSQWAREGRGEDVKNTREKSSPCLKRAKNGRRTTARKGRG